MTRRDPESTLRQGMRPDPIIPSNRGRMAFIRNAAVSLLILAVCGIGGAPSCRHQLRGEYPFAA
jgi:hypothetical protein